MSNLHFEDFTTEIPTMALMLRRCSKVAVAIKNYVMVRIFHY